IHLVRRDCPDITDIDVVLALVILHARITDDLVAARRRCVRGTSRLVVHARDLMLLSQSVVDAHHAFIVVDVGVCCLLIRMPIAGSNGAAHRNKCEQILRDRVESRGADLWRCGCAALHLNYLPAAVNRRGRQRRLLGALTEITGALERCWHRYRTRGDRGRRPDTKTFIGEEEECFVLQLPDWATEVPAELVLAKRRNSSGYEQGTGVEDVVTQIFIGETVVLVRT